MPNLDLSSFHDYDVRGIYGTEIDEAFFYHLGKSYACYLKKGPVAVGHDTRASSPALFEAFLEGMTDYGVDVVDLGNISTEMHNYSNSTHDYVANIIITASHNPPEYNGVKSALHGAVPLHGGYGLPEIKACMNQDIPKAETKGTVEKRDIFEEWVSFIMSQVDISKLSGAHIVVDAGNGMGGPVWQRLQSELAQHNVTIDGLYLEPDGNFPNHVADPSKEINLKDLREKVVVSGADLGIAIDGDADRAVFIDADGAIVPGTVMPALFAEHFLQHEKGACLYDATCGRIVPKTITAHGGTPVRTRVGHSLIKTAFKEHNAIFAGENSGHFYFRANGGAESSTLAGLTMVEIMREKGETMAQLVSEYNIYPRSGEINYRIPDGKGTIEQFKSRYSSSADSIDELDGLSVWFGDWWFNIRLSKTEPLLRLNVEADTRELLEEKLAMLVSEIESAGGTRKA